MDAVQTRLHDRVGTFLEHAAEEIAAVQQATLAGSAAGASRDSRPNDERVVTRLIVHPRVPTEFRLRFKERIKQLPGIDVALLSAVDEDSVEILLAHEREASVLDNPIGMTPEQIRLRARHVDRLELELGGVDWWRSLGEDQSPGRESGVAVTLGT